jgi:hypothetical protein
VSTATGPGEMSGMVGLLGTVRTWR